MDRRSEPNLLKTT